MGVPELDLSKKRPAKGQSVSFIVNQFAALQAGVPGATKENIKAQISFQNAYLYEGEVKKILEDKANEEGFDAKAFIELLKFCGCVKQGSTPAFGSERLIRINSEARCKEVANTPEDVPKIIELMTALANIRNKVNPLISDHASVGLAIKNKKSKKRKPVKDGAPEPESE